MAMGARKVTSRGIVYGYLGVGVAVSGEEGSGILRRKE